MSFNPYEAPPPLAQAVGVLSGTRADLRSVAIYQRGVMICILLYFAVYLGATATQALLEGRPEPPLFVGIFLGLAMLAVAVAGAVFVFLLSIKVYGTGLGVLFGVLTLVPCVGLLALLSVNSKATSILRLNGVKVGFLGANPSSIPL
ncbi:MAG: hypothetical protein K2Y37_25500 [Pirellulales bacterium]|nr:hypothetical protein [Pirellulales bacterium]